jgi:hypothetical protein
MKFIFLFFLGSSWFNAHSQSFEIPREEYSFDDIIEWKGVGAMLVNRDPSGLKRKINLTLISTLQSSTWNQSFNPKGKDAFYIASENSRYVYFLDNLELIEGKYFFSQLSAAGSVKSSSTLLIPLFKKLGDFDFSEMKLIDVVTTDKALVHLFRYHHTKGKKFIEIAIFMTHHNLISYGVILGETSADVAKDESLNFWQFVGSTGDQIYFATRENQTKEQGWRVKEFNSKSELKSSQFIPNFEVSFEEFEHQSFGTCGKNYMGEKKEFERNLLTQINGNFYLTGIVSGDGKRTLKTFVFNSSKWHEFATHSLALDAKSKSKTHMGVYPLNEGLAVKLEQESVSNVLLMPFEKSQEIIVTPATEKLIFNPSRLLVQERKSDFVISLPERIVYFERAQLNNKGPVKFDILKK